MDNYLLIAGITVFVIAAVYLIVRAKNIDKKGVETDAVVSQIKEYYDTDNGTSSYRLYVSFTDDGGIERESIMIAGGDIGFTVGDRVRIKYIPGKYKIVRYAGKRGE